MTDIFSYLKSKPYPGRGIILGRSDDNQHALVCYFIMGRSENSRNRVIVSADGALWTRAYDESKLTDPSLIIYPPVRSLSGCTIVTNGDQTDTVYEHLSTCRSFESAICAREFEPDVPNYTPRISGIIYPDGAYSLAIIRAQDGDASVCCRAFYDYRAPDPGIGHFISTYSGDGEPLPSFEGDPLCVSMSGNFADFADKVWDSLNAANKVAMAAIRIPLTQGETQTKIYNAL